MPFEASKARLPSPNSFGTKGLPITPDNGNDINSPLYPKAIVVTSIAGGANLTIVPAGNVDGEVITFTGIDVGYMPPYMVRRVMATGTTCSVASVSD